jgi:hypothetical protein
MDFRWHVSPHPVGLAVPPFVKPSRIIAGVIFVTTFSAQLCS